MARAFELREAGTGRLLGELATVDDLAPGAVVRLFRADGVQVEARASTPPPEAPPPAAAAYAAPAAGADKRRGRRA